ncbi:MAG: hypothetical protein E7A62_09650, partial [Actinomycetaceae bacterium]|nr:hypothetical protein [Actinomycetaceae bacterium]MDU0971232.1 hypothetical protein [Actinomycetaceae bacterium]
MARTDALVNVDEWIADFYYTSEETKGASFTKRVKARAAQWKQDAQVLGIENPIARLRGQLSQITARLAQLGDTDPTAAQGQDADALAQAVTDANATVRAAFGYAPTGRVSVTRGDEEVEFSGSFSAPQSLAVIDAMPVAEAEA